MTETRTPTPPSSSDKKSTTQSSTTRLLKTIAKDVHEEREKSTLEPENKTENSSIARQDKEATIIKEVPPEKDPHTNEEDTYSTDEDQEEAQASSSDVHDDTNDEAFFTEPSDSTATKVLMRAVYNSKLKTIKSMLSSDNTIINAADQVSATY